MANSSSMHEPFRLWPIRSAPIVPTRSVAGRTLMLLVAIMTFLSAVTLGAVVMVQKSAVGWSADVGREVTIQIRPVDGEVVDSNLRTAEALRDFSEYQLIAYGVAIVVVVTVLPDGIVGGLRRLWAGLAGLRRRRA